MSGETNSGAVIIGCFLFVAGAGLALLGGGCSLMVVSELVSATPGATGLTPFLVVSLAVLLGGGALAWLGLKIMTGGNPSPPAPPEH
jgi:hypothetical protein